MRYFFPLVLLALGIGVIGYVLLSPAFLGDYRSLLLTLPVLLILAREVYEHVPALTSRPESRSRMAMSVEVDEAGDQDCSDGSLDGLWTGTVRVWPRHPCESLRILPLHLSLAPGARMGCELIRTAGDHAISRACVTDYEPATGQLELEIAIGQGSHAERFEARLRFAGGRLLPENEDDAVTVDLSRARLVPAVLSPAP